MQSAFKMADVRALGLAEVATAHAGSPEELAALCGRCAAMQPGRDIHALRAWRCIRSHCIPELGSLQGGNGNGLLIIERR